MEQEEQVKKEALPKKSAAWIGANIGAGVLIVNFLVNLVGGIVLSLLMIKSFIVSLVVSLAGIWLGTLFGVKYVVRRAEIIMEQVQKISLIAAAVPLVFFLFGVGLNFFTASSGVEEYAFSISELVSAAIVTVIVFFLARYYLQKAAKSAPTAPE